LCRSRGTATQYAATGLTYFPNTNCDSRVIVDEDLESQLKAVVELIESSGATARRRHEQLQSTLTAVEKVEHELHQNIDLLKNIRDRVASFDVSSADLSLLKNVHDELLVRKFLQCQLNYFISSCSLLLFYVIYSFTYLFIMRLSPYFNIVFLCNLAVMSLLK